MNHHLSDANGYAVLHAEETVSNEKRSVAASVEPRSLRTYTPTQAVLAKSAGIYHWTPEGRRLIDFTSGVLVANLGHNPLSWMQRFCQYMGWPCQGCFPSPQQHATNGNGSCASQAACGENSTSCEKTSASEGFFVGVAMTTYNAVTPIEAEASRRLAETMRKRPGGSRMQQVMWAASGSEAIQKALWASMARDKARPMILATRHGFHGKKGLSQAVTGSEHDVERDPRVKFVSFPMAECHDLSMRETPFDPTPYINELDALWHQFGGKIGTLITEPYLGGGGSYHPHKGYLQALQTWCRDKDVVFILDEVQANFGRTGDLFAFETYGLEPDLVVLGKGLGNGVPVAATVGRADIMAALGYGDASDTWSANPLNCASVLATLDEFEANDVLGNCQLSSAIIEEGLVKLKQYPFVAAVRGEKGGMVWGVEFREHAGKTAAEWANSFVLAGYQGDGPKGEGIHMLGPLAKKVVRISPPLVITQDQARSAIELLHRCAERMNAGSANATTESKAQAVGV